MTQLVLGKAVPRTLVPTVLHNGMGPREEEEEKLSF